MKRKHIHFRCLGLVRPLLNSALALLMMVPSASSCCLAGTKDNLPADSTAIEEPAEKHLSLLIAGDLMQHMPQIKAALSNGSYNYAECFAGIKAEVEQADVAIVNFETTLAGPPYSGFPKFSAPDEFLRDAIDAGFDIMLTANNHCADTQRKGLDHTDDDGLTRRGSSWHLPKH